MFQILIDTNIYRKDPVQTRLPFTAVARLCKAKAATLHIPYIVLRELQTQQLDLYQKEMHAALKGVSSVQGRRLSGNAKKQLGDIKAALEAVLPAVNDDAANGIVKWAEEIGAVLYTLDFEDAKRAMEAYFQGQLPLKEPKIRKDIPDSFLFQSALTILDTTKELYVISEDGAFSDVVATVEGVRVLKSSNEFIELPEVQIALQKQDEVEKIAFVIRKLSEAPGELGFYMRSLGEMGMSQKIHSRSIPDDNHEATICSYGDPEDIEIDFTTAAYYGEGQFRLPFSCSMSVSAFYYIFNSDFFALDEEDMPSVSDHNDHYFEAESEFNAVVHDSISIHVQLDEASDDKEVEDYVEFDSVKIDEIDRIELADF